MSHSVVRFPPPPPTSNNLTSKQRAQLMRSSKKLSQVLGSTPHVLDWTGSQAAGNATSSTDTVSRSSSTRTNNASPGHRRSKSSPYADHIAVHERASPRPASRPSTANSTQSHSSMSSQATSSAKSEQAWRTPYDPLHRPPLLKLQPPTQPSRSNHAQRSSTYSDCASEFSIPDSPTAPSFSIPSEAAARRAKMQRLTRKLGDGIPPELVFPSAFKQDPESESEEDSPLIETPASNRKLPFSRALPTIPEKRPTTASSETRVEIVATPVQSPHGGKGRHSYRNAIYIIDSPDEHGLDEGWNLVCVGDPSTKRRSTDSYMELSSHGERPGEVVCLGVSASAGPVGRGRSGRWVKGAVALDQIAPPGWHGGIW